LPGLRQGLQIVRTFRVRGRPEPRSELRSAKRGETPGAGREAGTR